MCIPTLKFPVDFWSHISALITEAIMTLINSKKRREETLNECCYSLTLEGEGERERWYKKGQDEIIFDHSNMTLCYPKVAITPTCLQVSVSKLINSYQ